MAKDGTVLKVLVPLANLVYYAARGEGGLGRTQMGTVFIGEAYEELRDKDGKFSAIAKHVGVEILLTGVIWEVVPEPMWWSKRDEGGI